MSVSTAVQRWEYRDLERMRWREVQRAGLEGFELASHGILRRPISAERASALLKELDEKDRQDAVKRAEEAVGMERRSLASAEEGLAHHETRLREAREKAKTAKRRDIQAADDAVKSWESSTEVRRDLVKQARERLAAEEAKLNELGGPTPKPQPPRARAVLEGGR